MTLQTKDTFMACICLNPSVHLCVNLPSKNKRTMTKVARVAGFHPTLEDNIQFKEYDCNAAAAVQVSLCHGTKQAESEPASLML